MTYHFPKGFLWGTATSAHQIEGNNRYSDWWRAEQQGTLLYKSDEACDSYNRYEEDFDLAKNMHNNAHRLSIEWARIEPRDGHFDRSAIEHYRMVLRALKARGLEPFVTLHHFTNPTWFADKGGWKSKKAPYYFERYVRYVAEYLGTEARFWITVNEPFIVHSAGYLEGRWPPFHRFDLVGFVRAVRNMAEAHRRAAPLLRARNSAAQVGIAKNSNYYRPARGIFFPFNYVLAALVSFLRDRWFLNAIAKQQDFIGLNYYNYYNVHVLRGFYQSGKNKSDFGWEVYPEGIYQALKKLTRYSKPIYITENGIADADDNQRPDFIRDSLRAVHRAITEKVDVRGYFYWSLLDNFEWTEGFTQRFGLVEMDFATQKRMPRKSATIYSDFCKHNAVN